MASTLSWHDVNANFSDVNSAMGNATRSISDAGTIFGQLRKSILDEEQRAIENEYKEKEYQLALDKFGFEQDKDQYSRGRDLIKDRQWERTQAENERHNKASEGTEAARLKIALNADARAEKEFTAKEQGRKLIGDATNKLVDSFMKDEASLGIMKDNKFTFLTDLSAEDRARVAEEAKTNPSIFVRPSRAEAIAKVANATNFNASLIPEISALHAAHPELYGSTDLQAVLTPYVDKQSKIEQEVRKEKAAAETTAAEKAKERSQKLMENNNKRAENTDYSASEKAEVQAALGLLRNAGFTEKEIANNFLPKVAPTGWWIKGIWDNQASGAAMQLIEGRQKALAKKSPEEAKKYSELLESLGISIR